MDMVAKKDRSFYVAMPPLVPVKNPRSVHSTLPRDVYNDLVEYAIENKLGVSSAIRSIVENFLTARKGT